MLPAPIPANEPERIASLRRMLLLSTPDEQAFDRVTRAVQRMFKVPIALISLVDTNRQWFKSCIGLPVRETGRDVSFCGHAILGDEVFVIENARADPRFADNPLVTGEPHVIFYAGRPLRNAEGFTVGTLCIIDNEPREFPEVDRASLDDVGYWVEQIFLGRELSDSQRAVLEELDDARRNSMLDPVLNIWNAGAMARLIEQETVRADRGGVGLSLVKLGLSGAGAEDTGVCIEFMNRVRKGLRPYDSVGRAEDGASVFWLVLPQGNLALARQTVARLNTSLHAEPLRGRDGQSLRLDAGLGCADFLQDRPEAPELRARAEKAFVESATGASTSVVSPVAPSQNAPVY